MKKTPEEMRPHCSLADIPDIKLSPAPKADWDDSVDIGKKAVRLPDGRPLLIDSWMESGHAHNTYLLPKHYLEQSSTEELLNYLRSQGLPISGNDAGVCDFVDENGTPCWSVTVSSFVEHTADKRRLDALFVQFSGFEIGDIPLSQREVDDIFDCSGETHAMTLNVADWHPYSSKRPTFHKQRSMPK